MTSLKVGFIGIGLMGQPMCQRLLQAGVDLTIWNRHREKCQPLLNQGAKLATSPKELINQVDMLAICVADDAALRAVTLAEEGIFAGNIRQKIFIDFSSSSPELTRHLAQQAQIKDAYWIDCPVSGGVIGAEQGTLVMMAGGESSIVDKLRPLLSHLSVRVTWMGQSGAGQVTKICNQLIVAANAVLISEALALAEKAGVDATQLAPALAGGFADSKPFQILAPRMSQRNFEPLQWKVKTLLKDLTLANQLASDCNMSLQLGSMAKAAMIAHGDKGFLEQDLSTLILSQEK